MIHCPIPHKIQNALGGLLDEHDAASNGFRAAHLQIYLFYRCCDRTDLPILQAEHVGRATD